MDIKEISTGMVLQHISDVGRPKQKLIVVYVAEHITDSPIRCEWLDRTGNLRLDWFRPGHLEKW